MAMNPGVVDVRPRWNAEGGEILLAGEEVRYHGMLAGIVCQIETGEWLGIPHGTRRLQEWAGVPRHEKRIEAIKYLADFGAKALVEGREP